MLPVPVVARVSRVADPWARGSARGYPIPLVGTCAVWWPGRASHVFRWRASDLLVEPVGCRAFISVAWSTIRWQKAVIAVALVIQLWRCTAYGSNPTDKRGRRHWPAGRGRRPGGSPSSCARSRWGCACARWAAGGAGWCTSWWRCNAAAKERRRALA